MLLQADGEILGTGIEISMDVVVNLEIIKGNEIGWPRGKNDEVKRLILLRISGAPEIVANMV